MFNRVFIIYRPVLNETVTPENDRTVKNKWFIHPLWKQLPDYRP
jgi:hypothetical protein